ncbi:hypothetical protein EMCRGX_G000826 [Ephydatia muelleri]
MFPRSNLVRLPWFEKQNIHMVLRDSFQVMFLLRGPNPQRKFFSFRATPEVNFSALSPVHNVLPSRCPSPNKSAPRDIIVARVSAKGARCREVASLHVPIGQGCDRSKERKLLHDAQRGLADGRGSGDNVAVVKCPSQATISLPPGTLPAPCRD